ncbi:MAG: SpoIIE family protein phosphatase [Propionibacteriales bacterium]|nr:SpoIIE family protein phosphatase [Propionibacteriales bacterium]
MNLALRFSATSDVGRVRRNNQDSGFASSNLLVVADGMGGAAAGDLASAVTVETLRRLDNTHPEDMLEALAGAVHRANDRLGEIIEEDPSVEGMGTTVTAALFDGHRLGLAHIGDSRAYLFRNGQLTRLTHDHTFVQGLVDEGRITEAEARSHPHRSLILRALDGRHDTDPDLTTHTLQAGDRLLLCSDGLCGFVDDKVIAGVLASGTPEAASVELVSRALEAGGGDNITCVVGEVVDAAAPMDALSAATPAVPLLVGSAAEQAYSRVGDTANHAPVAGYEDEIDREFTPDPEELRYAPRPPRRFRWLRRILLLAMIAAIVGFAGKMAYDWTQRQYYVADSGGRVVIYQGVDADLPLSSLYETSALELTELPTYWRDRVVEGLEANDLEHAEDIVTQLEETARLCAEATKDDDATRDGRKGTGDRQGTKRPGDRRDNQQSPTESPTELPPDTSCEGVGEGASANGGAGQ